MPGMAQFSPIFGTQMCIMALDYIACPAACLFTARYMYHILLYVVYFGVGTFGKGIAHETDNCNSSHISCLLKELLKLLVAPIHCKLEHKCFC